MHGAVGGRWSECLPAAPALTSDAGKQVNVARVNLFHFQVKTRHSTWFLLPLRNSQGTFLGTTWSRQISRVRTTTSKYMQLLGY